MKKLLAVAATLTAATALVGVGTGTAFADPPAGTTPAATDVVGVGSDTTQNLLNAISSAVNGSGVAARTGVPGSKLYSFDAVGSTPITPKQGAAPIDRPNGSSAGITALESTTSSSIDFARSSRPRKTTDPASIRFVQYASDAVTVTTTTFADGSGSPANFSTRDLTAIYSCTATQFNQLPDNPVSGTHGNDTILPVLPQSQSGTRAFFLSAIGVTTPGPCVSPAAPEENEGVNPVFQNHDVVFPYSVAVALAQILHAKADGYPPGQTGPLGFPTVEGKFPATKSGNTYIINPNFPANFTRKIYNVVRTDSTTTNGIPADLEGLFGPSGLICKYGGSLIRQYGFNTLPAGQCGLTS